MTSTVTTDVSNVKNTFSSWDQCMTQDYCKYPAIIGIVLGSLFLFSIVFCIARCLCCGVECCCACCSCFNACCPSPRNRSRDNGGRYSDMNGNTPVINNHYHGSPNQGYQPGPAPPVYNPQSQYAQFDTRPKVRGNEDALPAMPSWDTANSRKVVDDRDDVELGRLNPVDEQRQPMLAAHTNPSPHAAYSDAAEAGHPYQQYGASQGGDLGGAYGQQNYSGSTAYGGAAAYAAHDQRSPNLYGAAAGGAQRPAQLTPAHSYGPSAGQHPAYRSASPYQQPSYTGYAASEAASTHYEPTSNYAGQESGIAYNTRPAPAVQPYTAPSGVPPVRRPVQDTWREV